MFGGRCSIYFIFPKLINTLHKLRQKSSQLSRRDQLSQSVLVDFSVVMESDRHVLGPCVCGGVGGGVCYSDEVDSRTYSKIPGCNHEHSATVLFTAPAFILTSLHVELVGVLLSPPRVLDQQVGRTEAKVDLSPTFN